MPHPARRARLWPIVVMVLLAVGLAGAWILFWNYAVAQSKTAIAGWLEREARLGRVYSSGSQIILGFFLSLASLGDQLPAPLTHRPPVACARSNIRPSDAPLYRRILLTQV